MKSAVIIVEDPAFATESILPTLNAFYKQITDLLTAHNYGSVTFNTGEVGTIPDEAATIWIGHGRGTKRLQFAPKDIRTYQLCGQSDEPSDPSHYVLSELDIDRLLMGARHRPHLYQDAIPENLVDKAINRIKTWRMFRSYYESLESAIKTNSELPEWPKNLVVLSQYGQPDLDLSTFIYMLYHGPAELRSTCFSGIARWWRPYNPYSFHSEVLAEFRKEMSKSQTKFGRFVKSVTHFDRLFADSREKKFNIWSSMFEGLTLADVPECIPENYARLLVEFAEKISKLDKTTVVEAWPYLGDQYRMFGWELRRG